MNGILRNMFEYIAKAFSGAKPIIAVVISGISYILFPEKSYLYAVYAVGGAAFVDIFTKSYSIIKIHGGYRKAVESGNLFSKTLWTGTEVKLISYLSIMILTGLSYRVIFLKQAGIALASIVYSAMFLREFQSNIENLMVAGADLGWLSKFIKKKEKQVLENDELIITDEDIENPVEEVDEYQEFLNSMSESEGDNE